MSLQDKLKAMRDSFSILNNRDYEFDAEFEDHPLSDSNVYRLHFLNYHRFGENYGMGPDNLVLIDYPYKPFMLPKNMSREDAFKVLSYLIDYIERKLNLEECSQKGVEILNNVLDLSELGFTRVDIHVGDDSDINELFTVKGRILLFKKSKYYSKYFEWYTEGITLEEVMDIYKKCEMEFKDISLEEVKKRCLN